MLTAPFFASNTTLVAYFFGKEIWDTGAGLVAAALIAICPKYNHTFTLRQLLVYYLPSSHSMRGTKRDRHVSYTLDPTHAILLEDFHKDGEVMD